MGNFRVPKEISEYSADFNKSAMWFLLKRDFPRWFYSNDDDRWDPGGSIHLFNDQGHPKLLWIFWGSLLDQFQNL